MSQFVIKTNDEEARNKVRVIQGNHMFIDDGFLYIYGDTDGRDLRGMYRVDTIIMADRTEQREDSGQ